MAIYGMAYPNFNIMQQSYGLFAIAKLLVSTTSSVREREVRDWPIITTREATGNVLLAMFCLYACV